MTLYKERLEPHLAHMPRNVLEGLQRVCRERRYAFMVPKEETTEYLPHLSCEVVYLPEGIFEMKYAFVFNVHSPYIGLLRYTCVPQVTKSGRAPSRTCNNTQQYCLPLILVVSKHDIGYHQYTGWQN